MAIVCWHCNDLVACQKYIKLLNAVAENESYHKRNENMLKIVSRLRDNIADSN